MAVGQGRASVRGRDTDIGHKYLGTSVNTEGEEGAPTSPGLRISVLAPIESGSSPTLCPVNEMPALPARNSQTLSLEAGREVGVTKEGPRRLGQCLRGGGA